MHYIGDELKIFAKAKNWKNYCASQIKPWLQGRVLEVGAGIGESTRFLCQNHEWCCLEPDPSLCKEIDKKIKSAELPASCRLINGTVSDLKRDSSNIFDTIIYIDVLEHIKNDQQELVDAASLLAPEGTIIIISPAHQQLFTPFDQAIGHYRRYNKNWLKKICPMSLKTHKTRYLDSIGLFASLANRLLLKQKMPSQKQLLTWDRIMVPLSKFFDPLLLYKAGKSIMVVYKKTS